MQFVQKYFGEPSANHHFLSSILVTQKLQLLEQISLESLNLSNINEPQGHLFKGAIGVGITLSSFLKIGLCK